MISAFSLSASAVAKDVFPEAPLPEFKELFDLDYALPDLAEKEGLYLDGTHHFNLIQGLPYNLDFIVKPLRKDA